MARPSARLDGLVVRLGGEKQRISGVPVDLSSMLSVRAAAAAINRVGGHLDALVNNAAVFVPQYRKSPDGFELMLATNLLGPFLLINLLRDRLGGGGRVVTVSAPSTTRVELTKLLDKQQFSALQTFGATKAADLMFSFELARRGKRWDVRSNAFHPGLVKSGLMREAPRPIRLITHLVAGPAVKAAQDLAELAVSPAYAGTTGWFFKGTRHVDPPKLAAEPAAQSELWRRCAELVELEGMGF